MCGEEIGNIISSEIDGHYATQIAFDGTFVAIPSRRFHVGIWTATDLETKPLLLEGHTSVITALCFGSRSFLCSCSDDYVIVWNIREALGARVSGDQAKGRVVGQTLGTVNYCACNADNTLVALCIDSSVLVIGTEADKFDTTLMGHKSKVNCAEFFAQASSLLVTASDDRTFKIWDVAKSELICQSSVISASPFLTIAMNPRAAQFALGTEDGLVRLYDLSGGKNPRLLFTLDTTKTFAKHQSGKQESQSSPEYNFRSEGFKVVSSEPAWKTRTAADEDVADKGEAEAGTSILGLHFAFPSSSSTVEAETGKSDQHFYAPSVVSDLLKSTSVLVIGVARGIMLTNAKSMETIEYVDLQDPRLGRNKGVSQEEDLMVAHTYAMAQTPGAASVCCCIGSLFGNSVRLLQLNTESHCNVSGHAHDELTVLSCAPLCDHSPLKAELTSQTKQPTVSVRKGVGKAKTEKSVVQNHAVTFHDRIKSSGYIANKPRKSMFQPRTNVSRRLPTSKSEPVISKRITKQVYPMEGNAPKHLRHKQAVADKPTAINSLKFSENGKNLACSLSNKMVQVLAMPLNEKSADKGFACVGHNGAVLSANWSRDSRWLISSSCDKTAKIWSSNYSEPILTLDCVKRSMSSDWPGTNRDNGNVEFTKEVRFAQFYYMDKFLLLTSGNKIYLYKYLIDPTKSDVKRYVNNSKYKLVKEFDMPSIQQVTALSAINSFYSYIVLCAGSNRSVEVIDMNVGQTVQTTPDVHARPVHVLCQNQGSAYVTHPPENYDLYLTAAVADGAKLWDLRTSRCICRYSEHKNRSHLCGAVFSPCSRFIAMGSEDKCAYIYDIRMGSYLHKLSGHTEVVSDVAFHPLYSQLVTATLDGNLRLFSSL